LSEWTVYNVADAFSDWWFDSTFDLGTRYRTTFLLSVPVRSSGHETIAVIHFLNRKD
jgi:hypothetical protein